MKKIITNLLIFSFIFTGLSPLSSLRAFSAPETTIPIIEAVPAPPIPATPEQPPPAPVPEPIKLTSAPPAEGILKHSSIKIDCIDPTMVTNLKGSFYPGGRGGNQLIIYTPKNGLRTGTNEFGAEAIVVNDTVVQLSGADTIIPRNGFVISGHGKAKTWINENITVGSKIYVDMETCTLNSYLTNDSFMYATKEKIKEVDKIMRYYRDNDIFYNPKNSQNYITKALESLKKAEKRPQDTQKYSAEAISSANKAMEYALPYYKSEFKGVWIRPTELSAEEISKTLDRIKFYGIENVFLETYYQGKTIFPSKTMAKYGIQKQRSEYNDFDPLKIWVSEAHKKGLKLHIWFETFYAGNENPASNPQNILSVYPEWGNKTRARYDSETPVSSLSEHNGYFLDPANPDVQAFLIELLEEIITTYNPDGINLDYIRYPQCVGANAEMSSWGYTEYARNEFMKASGLDPIDIKPGNIIWDNWSKYRQDRVTSFVFKSKQLTSKYNVTLTAVIFPDRRKSLATKMQDWKTWTTYNYVDGFTPLILTCDSDTAEYLINDIKVNSNPKTKIYPGLFVAFMNGNPDDLLRQIHRNRVLKTSGVVIFDYAHLNSSKYTDVLLTSVFKEVKEADKSQYKQEEKSVEIKEAKSPAKNVKKKKRPKSKKKSK